MTVKREGVKLEAASPRAADRTQTGNAPHFGQRNAGHLPRRPSRGMPRISSSSASDFQFGLREHSRLSGRRPRGIRPNASRRLLDLSVFPATCARGC